MNQWYVFHCALFHHGHVMRTLSLLNSFGFSTVPISALVAYMVGVICRLCVMCDKKLQRKRKKNGREEEEDGSKGFRQKMSMHRSRYIADVADYAVSERKRKHASMGFSSICLVRLVMGPPDAR